MEERLAAVLPVALASVAVAVSGEPNPTSAPSDDESALWPEGATMVAVAKDPDETAVATDALADKPSPEPNAPLPSLDAMVARIPPQVREALDDLFRVKFINVQRLPASSLKE